MIINIIKIEFLNISFERCFLIFVPMFWAMTVGNTNNKLKYKSSKLPIP